MLLERKTRTDITRKRDYQIREQQIKTDSKSFNDDLSRLENTTRKLAEQVNTIKMQQKQQKQAEQEKKVSFQCVCSKKPDIGITFLLFNIWCIPVEMITHSNLK